FSRIIALLALLSACVTTETKRSETRLCAPMDEITAEELREGQVHLIFFSSWCSSCADKLTATYEDKTVVVGTMDSPDNIERVFAFSQSSFPCYYDTQERLSQSLGIKSLPYQR